MAVFWTCFLLAAYSWRSTMGFIPVFVVPFSKRYCNIFLKMRKWESHDLWYNLAQKEFTQWGGNKDSKQNSHCLSCVLFWKKPIPFCIWDFSKSHPNRSGWKRILCTHKVSECFRFCHLTSILEVVSFTEKIHVLLCIYMYILHIYIYGTPPPKPTFLHFLLVCTVFLAYLGTFFFWAFFEWFLRWCLQTFINAMDP